MAIRFQCDCGLWLEAKVRLAGEIIRCPECSGKVIVPRVGEDPNSYSLGGASPGDDGWASSGSKRPKSSATSSGQSTFRPAVAKDTPHWAGSVQSSDRQRSSRGGATVWINSFLFPFRGGNLFTFLGWMMGFSFFSLMLSFPPLVIIDLACRIVLSLFAIGYFFHFLSEVIRSAAGGDEVLPETSSGSDVLLDAFNWSVGLAVGCGPWLIYQIWWLRRLFQSSFDHDLVVEWLSPSVLGQGLVILAILYTPMSLLATTLLGTWQAVNPVYVIPAIFKVPSQYFFTCGMIVMVWAGALSIYEFVLPLLISDVPFFWVVIPTVIAGWLLLYASIVTMHLLGQIYEQNVDRIGWQSR